MLLDKDSQVIEDIDKQTRLNAEFMTSIGVSVVEMWHPHEGVYIHVPHNKIEWDIPWIHVAISNGDPSLLGQGVTYKVGDYVISGKTHSYTSWKESYIVYVERVDKVCC